MDEPRWVLEVPTPGEDGAFRYAYNSQDSAALTDTMMAWVEAEPNLDSFLTWNW